MPLNGCRQGGSVEIGDVSKGAEVREEREDYECVVKKVEVVR